MAARRNESGLVYSSEHGRMCPHCGLPSSKCVCRRNPRKQAEVFEGDGVVRVRRETKGRNGKTVTTLTGIQLPEDELKDLAKDLKRKCGGGGAVKEGVIEIQGDHCDVLVAELERRNFRVKRAGG